MLRYFVNIDSEWSDFFRNIVGNDNNKLVGVGFLEVMPDYESTIGKNLFTFTGFMAGYVVRTGIHLHAITERSRSTATAAYVQHFALFQPVGAYKRDVLHWISDLDSPTEVTIGIVRIERYFSVLETDEWYNANARVVSTDLIQSMRLGGSRLHGAG